MMESVRQYFQDWSDACEYAKECSPDLSFLGNGEPYTALAFVGGACWLIWAVNNARLYRIAQASGRSSDLKTVVEQMKQNPSDPEKLAA